ncbi:MAG: type I-C CRISPR-associated protein Cas7/Csd2 [Thermoguttaceae bacterium]|jgi:CRISPR-associated protein Csd2|nr:type I-C CRISPR-associated protein Cas7/Csd2 [Thermoguttaceae bacterium]
MNHSIHTDPNRRHDFVLLFDVTDGNPNGDPDAGNLPRVDPETMQGIVTDVCLKRKIRNWVDATRGTQERYKIFVENRGYLVDHKRRAYEAVGAKKGDDSKADEAQQWMCQNYFDVRMFGAVLVGKKGEGYNCGQVRGPVQMTFARSIDQVVPLDLSITRVALENPGDKPREDEDEKAATGTMGRKALLPYGLFRGYGFFTPHFAKQTGVTADDLALVWEALQQMWTIDRSSSRGLMALRGLYVFTHDTPVGNAPAQSLFDRVRVVRKGGVTAPRAFSDYTVDVEDENPPEGVTLTRLVG